MRNTSWTIGRLTLHLILLAAVFGVNSTTNAGECFDSSEVQNFKVHSVIFKTLFGAIPDGLSNRLASHRNDIYSSAKASEYLNEIKTFYATDPAQQTYEQLIANKLKLSLKGGKTWLDCIEKVDVAECQRTVGTSQCVDVTIRRYFVDIDALDSSPYLLLFPRSSLAVLYAAIPRPLLALNPALSAGQDKRFGPSASADTATDLLDLGEIFGKKAESPLPPPAPTPAASTSSGGLEVSVGSANNASVGESEEPTIDQPKIDNKLLFRFKGRKSLTKDFYESSTSLNFVRTNALESVQSVLVKAKFDSKHVPLGNADFFSNALEGGLALDLHLRNSSIRLVNAGGAFRWSNNRTTADTGLPGVAVTENGYTFKALADGAVKKGVVRAGIWFDGGSLTNSKKSYQRVAFLAGYAKDFIISRKNDVHRISPPELSQTCWSNLPDLKEGKKYKNPGSIGVEVLTGAGHIWGEVPEYSRFHGGNMLGQFLYDELASTTLSQIPAGPIIRSLGLSKAGVVPLPGANPVAGGTSYWHASATVSVPIRAWSQPLIPYEWVTASKLSPDDKDFVGRVPEGAMICRDLKHTIKTLVKVSGVNLLVNQQARDALSNADKEALRLRNKDPRTPEEEQRLQTAEKNFADAKASTKIKVEDLFQREILPITDFIADNANVVAVKPLFMFDAARVDLSGVDRRIRYGLGGGFQIDVVLARFEFGYMAAIKRAPGDASGNFVGRLVMRRFF